MVDFTFFLAFHGVTVVVFSFLVTTAAGTVTGRSNFQRGEEGFQMFGGSRFKGGIGAVHFLQRLAHGVLLRLQLFVEKVEFRVANEQALVFAFGAGEATAQRRDFFFEPIGGLHEQVVLVFHGNEAVFVDNAQVVIGDRLKAAHLSTRLLRVVSEIFRRFHDGDRG